jgi:hypothetical protein
VWSSVLARVLEACSPEKLLRHYVAYADIVHQT